MTRKDFQTIADSMNAVANGYRRNDVNRALIRLFFSKLVDELDKRCENMDRERMSDAIDGI